jgi:predicted amidohydrolase
MESSDLSHTELVEHGFDARRGNLLGVQPFVRAADYASEDTLSARLSQYTEIAAQKGWLNPRTVVVWPEYVGTWLAAAGEGPAVYKANNLNGAMRLLAMRHMLRFAREALSAREVDRIAASLFRLKANSMARRYQAVFSGLARRYSVTMVAGSILLPSPTVKDGQVIAGAGPLYNISAVFGPDGLAHARLVRKVVPIKTELPFVAPAPVAELPTFETPAGRLGVLICADSWYPAPYERLQAQGVELIAVPSSITTQGLWDRPWEGYDGAAAPADVDSGDVGRLTEGQAWRKYALAGRIGSAGATHGINVFLRGVLWDINADSGQALAVSEGQITESSGVGAAILNLWL